MFFLYKKDILFLIILFTFLSLSYHGSQGISCFFCDTIVRDCIKSYRCKGESPNDAVKCHDNTSRFESFSCDHAKDYRETRKSRFPEFEEYYRNSVAVWASSKNDKQYFNNKQDMCITRTWRIVNNRKPDFIQSDILVHRGCYKKNFTLVATGKPIPNKCVKFKDINFEDEICLCNYNFCNSKRSNSIRIVFNSLQVFLLPLIIHFI